MPPLPNVPGTAIVRVLQQLTNHTAQNVLHFNWGSTAATVADMTALARNVFTGFSNLYSGVGTGGHDYISSEATLEQVTATDLTTSSGAFFATTDTPVNGAASQVALNNASLLISSAVATRFRGGHGRTYLTGLSPDNTTNGQKWNVGSIIADIDTWWQTTLANILAGTPHPYTTISHPALVIVSYYNQAINPTPPHRRTTPVVYPVITSGIADPVIRSQRRRVRNSPTAS